MFRLLNIAIHQFAKRQITWFRKMEREGINIHWINSDANPEEKAEVIVQKCFGKDSKPRNICSKPPQHQTK
jgi:tRNA A37 N6-isopentenylltransferase MiaA